MRGANQEKVKNKRVGRRTRFQLPASESRADLGFHVEAHGCLFEGLDYLTVTLEMVRLIL